MKITFKGIELLRIRTFEFLLSIFVNLRLSVSTYHLCNTILVYRLHWNLNMRMSLLKVFYSLFSRFRVILVFRALALSFCKRVSYENKILVSSLVTISWLRILNYGKTNLCVYKLKQILNQSLKWRLSEILVTEITWWDEATTKKLFENFLKQLRFREILQYILKM